MFPTQIVIPSIFNEESSSSSPRGKTSPNSQSDFIKIVMSRAECPS